MAYFTQKRLHWLLLSMLLSSLTSLVWAASLPADSDDVDDDIPPPKTGLLHRLLHGREHREERKPQPPKTPRVPVIIDIDNATLHKLINDHLPLITQQLIEDLDDEQVSFLAEEAPEQTQTMLETEGYFNARVNVEKQANGYIIHIETGPRTHIENVDVSLTGNVTADDSLTNYYKSAIDNWVLPVGDPFTQSNWSASKSSVLTAIVRKKYPLATISASRATIDPQRNQAELSLTVDSKQPIYFGDIQVSGNERYPVSIVTGMASFSPGSPYDLDKLLDYQQALEQDSHYGNAVVSADFDHMQNDHVPVLVKVSEMQRQKLTFGLRYDTKNGPGFRGGYDHYNVFHKGFVGSTLLDTDRYETTFGIGLSQPRNNRGHYWTSNLNYTYSTVQHLQSRALSSGFWKVRDRDEIDSRVGVEYVTESSKIENGPDLGHSYATMLTASWKRQNIETQLRPANGYYLEGKIGTTMGKLLSSASMQRVTASGGYYFTPENKKYGTWVLRSQIGYVHTGDTVNVPSILMFRAGGANSVRGYEMDSIGINSSQNSVLPNRTLAVASVEYQIPVYKDFALALFHDAGSVSKNFSDMQWRHGSGFGIRWFSPVAPFAFDIAYGHHDKKWRWSISLGTKF
ncbi:autotransporter assembly complex family protein [Snodgrassella sp. ESL0253]|uniref:autotransporter assembly complex protein TamA n=1 Tax=Snodgrassella sp. ESL0253 TaxID=2705031 RepID=UPI001EEA2E91|nr:autotransporter assembly complex family protein [Snodgrassella sp. ESL0253]